MALDLTFTPIPQSAFQDLVAEINKFQNRLSDEMEVGVSANGAGLTIHVESLNISGQMVVFVGVDPEGRAAQLIQHYTQIGVQLIAVEKLDSKARRIGF